MRYALQLSVHGDGTNKTKAPFILKFERQIKRGYFSLTVLFHLFHQKKKKKKGVLPSTLQSLPKTIFYRKKGSAHSLSVSECVALKKKREI